LWALPLFLGSIAIVLSCLHAWTRPSAVNPARPARPATLEAMGDLAEGVPLGPFQISGVTEPVEGAVLVHAKSAASEVTYEVRLASDAPLPAATAGRYAVYYRATDAGPDVLGGAAALARLLQRAPANVAPLAGLTTYPVAAPP